MKKPSPKSKSKPASLYTHIAVVLDRSGSMDSMKAEIIGGFNSFLSDQQKVPGRATMTLVQFDDQIENLADFLDLDSIKPLNEKTYVPRGMTKLYDAIGLTVKTVRDKINGIATRPDKVLVIILTDGQENSSQEYTTASIKSLLEEQQKAGWEFTFIGANQDAILTARGIGLTKSAANLTFSATPDGAKAMMRSLSASTVSYRCCASAGFAYGDEDRDAQNLSPQSSTASSTKAAFAENGYLAGKLGGLARAASMTSKARSSVASHAAKARWAKASV
jgi:uncharacterized protein YegL